MKERHFRNKIIVATFILDILVILTHSQKPAALAGEQVTQIAVPGFFLISGYLFFRNLTLKSIPGKWIKRLRSVVVPYLLWNLIYFAGYLILTNIPAISRFIGVAPIQFNVQNLLEAIFLYKYNPVFWFIFQLILLFALSPVIYILVKNMYVGIVYLIALLTALYLGYDLSIVNTDAVFYYSFAAFLAQHLSEMFEKDAWLEKENGNKKGLIGGALLIFASIVFFFVAGATGKVFYLVLLRISAVLGGWIILPMMNLFEARDYMKNSFLIYAMHFAIVRFINKAGAALLPHTSFFEYLIFFISPVIVFAVVAVLAKPIRKYLPALNGFRM